MAWPDDPYRTGQQLYRRPAATLAAFTTWPTVIGGKLVPTTTAIVYLPLHRTRPVTVTGQMLAFGFRAASVTDPAEVPAVAAVADLDLMQARRHAAVLAGYHLADDLAALQRADSATIRRGLSAVAVDWASRSPAAGRAALFDGDLEPPGSVPLGRACRQASISPVRTGIARPEDRHPATLAVERSLAIALLCARHQGRYEWAGTLKTMALMDAFTWDCLPWPDSGGSGAEASLAAAHGQRQ